MKSSKSARKKIKKPNAVLYFLVYIIFYPFLKLMFRLCVDRKGYRPPKGPFIVVSNHKSFMDFLLTMLTIYPRRVNAVAAQKFFLYSPLNKLLPMMGCIPKNLFDADIRSIIGIKAVLKRGDRILLFPEGRCTVHGPYMGIQKTTGALLKGLEVPVVSCNIEGAYNCMPFWRKGFRFGRTKVTLANLFSADDMRTMSADEINAAIDRRLGGLDLPPPKKPFKLFFERRLAEGLENIIYYCPKCGGEFCLVTKGNAIFCTACQNAATLDRFGKLTPNPEGDVPESVDKWYTLQVRHEMQALKEDMSLAMPVTVRIPAKKEGKGVEFAGSGTLTLTARGWSYNGELSGEAVNLFFPLESVPALPFDPNDDFQIYAEGKFYMFGPKEDARACAKMATIGECAYWKFGPGQMTPGHDSGFAEN